MKLKPIVAALFIAMATPASAQLLDTVDGKWAVDGACSVPAKTYVAVVDRRAQTITWQDGLGNIDIEHILWSGENEFRTMTEASFHARRGNSYGQGWIYTALQNYNYDAIRVVKSGRTFIATRCDLPVAPVSPSSQCVVADPSGTPLNVRTGPNTQSKIVATLDNGTAVGVHQRQARYDD